MRTAAPKDRSYLESLNLKSLRKDRKPGDQPAREFYEQLQQEAKEGPLFGDGVLSTIEQLPELPKVVAKWIGNLHWHDVRDINARDLNLIVDWVQKDRDAAPQLPALSWARAVTSQWEWHTTTEDAADLGDYITNDVVLTVPPYTFVDVTDPQDLKTEGNLMGHCVGSESYAENVKSGSSRIYSLRDSKNRPHVTVELDLHDKTVEQCNGHSNTRPIAKYVPALTEFFEHIGYYDGLLPLPTAHISSAAWHALSNHTSSGVRQTAAMSRRAPPDVLTLLARDDDAYVRLSVANNPNTPATAFRVLARDKDTLVRMGIAERPDTPIAVQKILAKDKAYEVRKYLAKNVHTSPTLLVTLAADTNHDVVITAKRNPNYRP